MRDLNLLVPCEPAKEDRKRRERTSEDKNKRGGQKKKKRNPSPRVTARVELPHVTTSQPITQVTTSQPITQVTASQPITQVTTPQHIPQVSGSQRIPQAPGPQRIPQVSQVSLGGSTRARRVGGRDPTVLLTVVGNSSEPTPDMKNPDLIPNDENMEIFTANEMVGEMSSGPAQSVEVQKPVKMNRVNWLCQNVLCQLALPGVYWHKFTIFRGVGYSKVEIMHALLRTVYPQAIAPVMYRHEESDVTFLARNCLGALLSLNKAQMQIQIQTSGPLASIQVLDVEVILCHSNVQDLRVHLHGHLNACLNRRFDKTLRMLDLSAFHMDPELSEVVFWALWAPKNLTFVLNLLKPRYNTIRYLNLSENELNEVPKLYLLSKLEVLDLSSNKISNISALKGLRLLEIVLDNNPFCAKYQDHQSYVKNIKELLPSIKKIDGVYPTLPDLPVWRRNYLPSLQKECVALVDQFLQHYFSLLDGDDRQRLRGMYHPDAMFSLTCNYVPGQSTSSTARLTRYTLESRNLLRLSDYSKSQQLLSQGAEEVLATLHRLPHTEHDPYSFAVDLPYYTEDRAVIVVSGVFREPSIMNDNLIRSFSRTFVLLKVASKEYQIVNELLTVSNASTKQAEESFQYPRPKVAMAKLSFNPAQDLTDADRKQMIRILSRLTEMNHDWAQKCLEQTKWDIKWALVLFSELLEMEKLPRQAFDVEEERSGDNK